jgi:hypothetical protein
VWEVLGVSQGQVSSRLLGVLVPVLARVMDEACEVAEWQEMAGR